MNVKNQDGADEYVSYEEDNTVVVREKLIHSGMQTKLFDFSLPGYFKNIDQVCVEFGNNGGKPIDVTFVTNEGNESNSILLTDCATNERDAEFIKVENFYPSLRVVRTFGLKIECDGQLFIDGLSMKYRVLGGVK